MGLLDVYNYLSRPRQHVHCYYYYYYYYYYSLFHVISKLHVIRKFVFNAEKCNETLRVVSKLHEIGDVIFTLNTV